MVGQVSQMDGVERGGCGQRWAGRLRTPWLSSGPQGCQGEEPSSPSPCEPLSHHSWTFLPPSHCIPGHSVRPCVLSYPAHSVPIRGISRLAGTPAWGTVLGMGWLRAPLSYGWKERLGQSQALEAGPLWAFTPPAPRQEPHPHGLHLALGNPQSRTKNFFQAGESHPAEPGHTHCCIQS